MQFYWCLLLASLVFVSGQRRTTSMNTIKKYLVITNHQESWYRALHYCDSHGLRFASVFSRAENDQLLKQIRDSGVKSSVWIGGTNLGNEPDFYWVSRDRAITYSDWKEDEPNNLSGYEDCLELRFESDLRWNDTPCDEKKNFVCEEEISQLPGTQSLSPLLR